MFIFIFGQFLDFWLQLVYKGLCTRSILCLSLYLLPLSIQKCSCGAMKTLSNNFAPGISRIFRLNGSNCGNFDNFFLENSVPFAAVSKFSKGLVKWKAPKMKRAFSPTWPASLQIYWNKTKRVHKKRVQLLNTNMAAVSPNGHHNVRWKRSIVEDVKMANFK